MFGSRVHAPLHIIAFAAAYLAIACAGAPKPVAGPETQQNPQPSIGSSPTANPQPAPQNAAATPDQAFDPTAVTDEVKSATIIDVRAFIDSMNQIIRRQDYDAWRSHLTDDYIQHYSDPAILMQYSQYPVIKGKGIKLQTLKDYFINVVYPSRQNDKVDDIEFVGENLIKAITVSQKGDRNILYMLEKHDDTWKIGIGR